MESPSELIVLLNAVSGAPTDTLICKQASKFDQDFSLTGAEG